MNKKIFASVQILAMIGILLALYLLFEQVTRVPSVCNINATINCDAIISGEVSTTFGIPTPLYGLIGYIVIFFAAVFRMRKLLISMATFGLAFCLWIAYRELFELHVICPVCIGCQLVMLTTFTLAVILMLPRNRNN